MSQSNLDISTIKVIRKRNPKVTDPICYPNVVCKYEGQFKGDYVKVLQDMTMMIASKMGEYV